MYKCWNCEALFEEPVYKEFTEEYEAWGHIADISYTESYCPICGDEDFEEIEEIDEEEE
jgi:hypothetical protein